MPTDTTNSLDFGVFWPPVTSTDTDQETFMPDDAERIDLLETRLAFQEDTISTLNDALVDQQSRLDHLESLLSLVIERLRNPPEALDPGQLEDPPPPHY